MRLTQLYTSWLPSGWICSQEDFKAETQPTTLTNKQTNKWLYRWWNLVKKENILLGLVWISFWCFLMVCFKTKSTTIIRVPVGVNSAQNCYENGIFQTFCSSYNGSLQNETIVSDVNSRISSLLHLGLCPWAFGDTLDARDQETPPHLSFCFQQLVHCCGLVLYGLVRSSFLLDS